VAFSSNGKLLASASFDCTVRLWDIKVKKAIQKLDTEESIHNISFSDDGSYLMTECGLLELSCLHSSVDQSQFGFSLYLSIKKQWVACRREDILWLPPLLNLTRVKYHLMQQTSTIYGGRSQMTCAIYSTGEQEAGGGTSTRTRWRAWPIWRRPTRIKDSGRRRRSWTCKWWRWVWGCWAGTHPDKLTSIREPRTDHMRKT